MAADTIHHRLVLFSGGTNGSLAADTWTWDGTTWTQRHPATSPAGRVFATMASLPNGGVVLFGGQAGDGTLLADTWSWDGGAWIQQAPPTSPSKREFAQMANDGAGRVVLFGGLDVDPTTHAATFLGDTWTIASGGGRSRLRWQPQR
jgi:hypothetical protein